MRDVETGTVLSRADSINAGLSADDDCVKDKANVLETSACFLIPGNISLRTGKSTITSNLMAKFNGSRDQVSYRYDPHDRSLKTGTAGIKPI